MRVLIVDDHAAMRRAVRSELEDMGNLEVVGEAGDGEQALSLTEYLHPDLIIMDINMPLLDGLSAAEIIKKYHPETRILIFSMHRIREFIETAKRLGLSGYVPKEENGPSLRDAVEAVLHNQTYFPTVGATRAAPSK